MAARCSLVKYPAFFAQPYCGYFFVEFFHIPVTCDFCQNARSRNRRRFCIPFYYPLFEHMSKSLIILLPSTSTMNFVILPSRVSAREARFKTSSTASFIAFNDEFKIFIFSISSTSTQTV